MFMNGMDHLALRSHLAGDKYHTPAAKPLRNREVPLYTLHEGLNAVGVKHAADFGSHKRAHLDRCVSLERVNFRVGPVPEFNQESLLCNLPRPFLERLVAQDRLGAN